MRGDRRRLSGRKLWRRHSINREVVELWDEQARNRIMQIDDAIWSNGAKAAASLGILVRNNTRLWKLPEFQLDGQVVKTEYRIKVLSDESWWQLSRTDLLSSKHFRHVLSTELEKDG